MKIIQNLLTCLLLLCATQVRAQYYNDDFSLDDPLFYEEEEKVDSHAVYLNHVYVQYSPTRYNLSNQAPHLSFNEFALGYTRAIQVLENKHYYAEVGAQLKYSTCPEQAAYGNASFQLLTFKLPINVVYKFYLSKNHDIALAPYAGVNFHAGLWGQESVGNSNTNLYDHDSTNATQTEWERCQLGWQAGFRFYLSRFYLGVQYGRDFPDKNKEPHIHQCSASFGVCF